MTTTYDSTLSEFKRYYRKADRFGELRPYVPGEPLPDPCSVSAEDEKAGSPKAGDMIARNPDNHRDQWLISEAYFKEHYDPEAVEI